MELVHGLDGLRQLPAGAVVSIGNYDGVHLGHQKILGRCRQIAMEAGNRPVAVITFEPHPLSVLRPQSAPPRLTGADLKQELLGVSGVDYLAVLAPERQVLNLTAEEFWVLLRDQVRPTAIVEGEEFNFGKGRGGTIDKLRRWMESSEVRLEVVQAVDVVLLDKWMVRASSSIIRWLVAYGRVRDAAICLGRPYVLRGPVVEGFRRGRTIGVPTANLRCDQQLVPDDGVYAGRCTVKGQIYPAAMSIGRMPTFGENARQVEAHLIGFDGDLYGQTLDLEVVDWLREQRKFDGMEALKARMKRDLEHVLERVA